MKKSGLILALILISSIFILADIKAQDEPPIPGLPSGINPEKIQDLQENLPQRIETKWEYLEKEYKNIALKNPFIKAIDKVLTKISIIFRGLIGIPYQFSFYFFITLLVWILLSFLIADFSRAVGFLKGVLSYLFGMAIMVLIANVKILIIIISAISDFIMAREMWWARLLAWILFFAVLGGITYCETILSKYLSKKNKKEKEQETEQYQKEIKGYTEKMKKSGNFNNAGAGI